MNSNPPENPSDRNPVPVYMIPCTDRDDEISLIDLWMVLAKHKAIILVVFLIALMLAAAYLFFAKPVYRAQAYLLAPNQWQFQEFLINDSGLSESDRREDSPVGDANRQTYTPVVVFSQFLENFNSQAVQRKFFADRRSLTGDKAHVANGEGSQVDYFLGDVFEVVVNKQDSSAATASVTTGDRQLAAEYLNAFVDFVDKYTARQLIKNVNAEIEAQVRNVERQIAAVMKLASQARDDKITRLQEALSIARAVGKEDVGDSPIIADSFHDVTGSAASQEAFINLDTRVLEAEIAALRARKSDAPFVEGLRDLKLRRAYLETISLDPRKISTAVIDTRASSPDRPVKPKMKLVLALSIVIGLMLGILGVFIAEFVLKVRRETALARD